MVRWRGNRIQWRESALSQVPQNRLFLNSPGIQHRTLQPDHTRPRESLADTHYRRHAAASGIPRLKSTSTARESKPAVAAAPCVRKLAGGSRRMLRTCPVRGLRRIAIETSLRESRVTDPPGPVRVMVARLPSHPARGEHEGEAGPAVAVGHLGHREGRGEQVRPVPGSAVVFAV